MFLSDESFFKIYHITNKSITIYDNKTFFITSESKWSGQKPRSLGRQKYEKKLGGKSRKFKGIRFKLQEKLFKKDPTVLHIRFYSLSSKFK